MTNELYQKKNWQRGWFEVMRGYSLLQEERDLTWWGSIFGLF